MRLISAKAAKSYSLLLVLFTQYPSNLSNSKELNFIAILSICLKLLFEFCSLQCKVCYL